MIRRARRRTRGRKIRHRSPLSGSLRLTALLAVLVGINVYVFFFRGGTSVREVLRAASLPPQRAAHTGSGRPAADHGRRFSDTLAPDEQLVTLVLGPGETLSGKLLRQGIERGQAESAVATLRTVADLRRIRPGATIRLRLAGQEVRGLELETSPIVTYRVFRTADGLRAERVEQPLETRVAHVGGAITSSLYDAVHATGEQTSLVAAIADLFAHDINFYVDPQPGDTFRVLVEKRFLRGDFYRYGRILAAEYAGKVGTFRAFFFQPESGDPGYYDEQGRNCAKVLLKCPLKFARLTSRFDLRRMHPILHVERGHYGVDYGAPVGTPVWASASGKVVMVGKVRGAGNAVILAHPNGMTTHYYHLSRFARGLARGQYVSQKQVIGYVGSTGLSTGPHLHFAIRQGSAYIDPLKIKVPRNPPLPTRYRAEFQRLVVPRLAELAAVPVTPPPAATGLAAGAAAAPAR